MFHDVQLAMLLTIAWIAFLLWTVVTVLPGWLTGSISWNKGQSGQLKSIAGHNKHVLLWGIMFAAMTAAIFTVGHVFWPGPYSHRFVFWMIVGFPAGLWAGNIVVKCIGVRRT